MQYISKYESPLGKIYLASDGEAICGLWFDNQKYFGSTLKEEWKERELPVFEETKKWLDIYFQGMDPGPIPKLHLKGSDFRMTSGNPR